MTDWWDRRAATLQDMGRLGEREQVQSGVSYDDETVRIAIVHAREDIVLVVSHLSSLNRQIATLKFIAVIIAAAAVYIAYQLGR